MPLENLADYTIEYIPPPYVAGLFITGHMEGVELTADGRNAFESVKGDQQWTLHKVEGRESVYTIYGPGPVPDARRGWSVSGDQTVTIYSSKNVKRWDLRPVGTPEENHFKISLALDPDEVVDATKWVNIDHTTRQISLDSLPWISTQAVADAGAQASSIGGTWKFTKAKE